VSILDFIRQLNPEILRFLISSVALITIAIVYLLLSRFMSRTGKRLELSVHVMNTFKLLLRVVTIVIAVYSIFAIFGISTEIFLGSSALIGAVIGFGSSQTINNFVAGFYILITKPFKVKDYVKIGDVEGQVEEITVNYTNLYTPSFNLLKVPNTQVMNSRVLNMTHEGFIRYTVSIGFPHDTSNSVLIGQCIQPAIEEFHTKYKEKQLRKPEAYFEAGDRLGRSFLIRIFIPLAEAKVLYVLKPELLDMIMKRWDVFKKR